MVYALAVTGVAGAVTLPLALVSAIADSVKSIVMENEPDTSDIPSFLPVPPDFPSFDIESEFPSRPQPGKHALEHLVLVPENILAQMPNPLQFMQNLRSTESPAEVLRDIEGPFEIFMSVPGPIRELPNPIADLYYTRQGIMWLMWDSRTLWGSGFDNFIRNDVPLLRMSLTEMLNESKSTMESARDTNVYVRRKVLPKVPRTIRSADKLMRSGSKALKKLPSSPF